VRDRLVELLPLLLVGVFLLAFQLSRGSAPILPFQTLPTPTPTSIPGPVASRATLAAAEQRLATPQPKLGASACDASRPRFVGGLATLKAALGASMGEPIECERSINAEGDTHQKTTTGLAYYRRRLNVACFTTGWDHWGLLERGLVHWAGTAVDPPVDAALITR
jgi:hypothetical protein